MRTKTFQLNGATITVAPETGDMYIDCMVAESILKGDDSVPINVNVKYNRFALAWSRSTIDGDLGFAWPESPNDADEMRAACEAWLELPGLEIERWLTEIEIVNRSPNDPDLKPPTEVSQKKETAKK